MFSKSIATDLLSLVGFRQNTDSGGTQLTGLTTSDSGLYVNDVHPYLTINNLASVAQDGLTDSAFTAWLQGLVESSIMDALYTWVNEKVVFNNANRVIDAGVIPLIQRDREEVSSGNWVGLELIPPGEGRAITLHRVGLDFMDASIADIGLKIYRADDHDPVWEADPTAYTYSERIKWVDVGVTLGEAVPYYLVYNADGLRPVNSTGVFNSKFFVRGVDTGQSDVSQIWDLEENSYMIDNNWGLLIDYTYGCDLTDFIVKNKLSFARLVQYGIGIRLLRELVANPNARVNRNEVNVQGVRWDLEGDTQGRPLGIIAEYQRELKSLRLDMSGIDNRCLGC